MESNRNLSSIISKIRDEGPPGASGPAVPVAPVDTGPALGADAVQQRGPADAAVHRTSRKLLLGLVLPLAVIVGMVLFAGGYTGHRDDDGFAGLANTMKGWLIPSPGPAGDGAVTGGTVLATGAVDAQVIRELKARQFDIMTRLDRLTDTVTALGETASKNWIDNSTAIASLRQEQRASLDALEAKVKSRQQQFAGESGKTTGTVAPPAVQAASQAKVTPAARVPAVQDTPGLAVAGEEWVVNVASSSREQPMLDLAEKLKEQGIPAERQTLTIEGELMYRLRVPGFATSGEARRYASKLEEKFGLRGPWVSRK